MEKQGGGPDINVRGDRLSGVKPIGGPEPTVFMRGLEGLLKSQKAAVQEIGGAATQMRIFNERSIRMATSIETIGQQQSLLVKAITDSVAEVTAEVLRRVTPVLDTAARSVHSAGRYHPTDQYQRGPDGYEPLGAPEDAPRPPGRGSTASFTQADRAYQRAADGADRPTLDAPSVGNYERVQQARGYSIGKLRQDATKSMAKSISQIQIGKQGRYVTDPMGNLRYPSPVPGEFGDIVGEAEGAVVRDVEGKILSGGGIKLPGAAKHFLRNEKIANNVRTVAGNVQREGFAKGVMNSLPKGLGTAAAGVTAAYMVGNEALDFAQNQKASNAKWQQISGGGQSQALSERMKGRMFRWSQRGHMSGEMADELYRGVAEVAPGDKDFRDGALDLASENWRKFGMEVKDSIELIRVSAQHGQKNLTGVAQALGSVTKAAQAMGMNTAEARKEWTANYTAALPNTIGEGTAATAAAGLSISKVKLGEDYANVNMGGMFGEDHMRMLAANQQMTVGRFMGKNQGAKGGVNLLAANEALVRDTSTRMLRESGADRAVAEYKSENNITGALTPEQAKELQGRLLNDDRVNLDPFTIKRALDSTGAVEGLEGDNALSFALLSSTGGVTPSGEAEANQRAGGLSDIDMNDPKQWAEMNAAIGSKNGLMDTRPWTGDARQSREQYQSQIRNKKSGIAGKRSGLIEKMLENFDESQRFQIKVKDKKTGKMTDRVMNANDALNYHADQLARGDVKVVSGTGSESKNLAEAYGFAVNEDIKVEDHQGGRKKGQSLEDFKKDEEKKNKGGGQITVVPSEELYRLLRIETTGNLTVKGGPPDPHGQPGDYPTGTPRIKRSR